MAGWFSRKPEKTDAADVGGGMLGPGSALPGGPDASSNPESPLKKGEDAAETILADAAATDLLGVVGPYFLAGTENKVVEGFAAAATFQAAAMISEDVRTFMQSMEQIFVAATAKAIALSVEPATKAEAESLLDMIKHTQTSTMKFATDCVKVAAQVATLNSKTGA